MYEESSSSKHGKVNEPMYPQEFLRMHLQFRNIYILYIYIVTNIPRYYFITRHAALLILNSARCLNAGETTLI